MMRKQLVRGLVLVDVDVRRLWRTACRRLVRKTAVVVIVGLVLALFLRSECCVESHVSSCWSEIEQDCSCDADRPS